MVQLYTFLETNRKPSLLDPLLADKAPALDPRNPIRTGDEPNFFNAFAQDSNAKKTTETKKNGKGRGPLRREMLYPGLQNLPVVKNQGAEKGQVTIRNQGGDNSNTQFALIGLWAARRHNVNTDPAHLASFQRYVVTQNKDGGWGYHPYNGSTNTMTSVGLIGLAMGHGASPEVVRFNPKDPKDIVVKPALDDPRIQSGLQALARNIGEPSTAKIFNSPMQNLYFLWSVERVAMLYDLRTIGGKDWYGWGAQTLVHYQQPNGSWPNSTYPGANVPVNTCFALLFLKRSNLVQDLTNNLRLYTGIRDTDK
jgi:hypothetical protein